MATRYLVQSVAEAACVGYGLGYHLGLLGGLSIWDIHLMLELEWRTLMLGVLIFPPLLGLMV